MWQSSVRGCRFSFVFVYLIKCSPVPASFFPYISTALHWCRSPGWRRDTLSESPRCWGGSRCWGDRAAGSSGDRQWLPEAVVLEQKKNRWDGRLAAVLLGRGGVAVVREGAEESPRSHLFFFCSSTTASGSHWRSPLLPAARSPQHRDPPQQRGLSDSVSLLHPGFRHQCNAVDMYGKKEAGTGEHLNTFNQINKHKWKAAAPHGRLPHTKHKLKTQAWSSLVFHCCHSSFNPSEAPPWDSRPVSGAGVVHYQLLHRPRSVPTALGPAPLATVMLVVLICVTFLFLRNSSGPLLFIVPNLYDYLSKNTK